MRFGYWFFFDQNIETISISLIIPIRAVTISVLGIIPFIAFQCIFLKIDIL